MPVYKSEDKPYDSILKAHRWNPVKILTSILCKEEAARDIRVDFYQYSSSGNHKFLGANQSITLDKIRHKTYQYDVQTNAGKAKGSLQLN